MNKIVSNILGKKEYSKRYEKRGHKYFGGDYCPNCGSADIQLEETEVGGLPATIMVCQKCGWKSKPF